MKITIMGGTGYLGQAILAALKRNNNNFELVSLSRSGSKGKQGLVKSVSYVAADFSRDGEWQNIIADTDVVVDCVGIFLPNKKKQTTYLKNSIEPAKRVIDQIKEQAKPTTFIFIAANNAPRILRDYMEAKHEVIDYGGKKLDNQFIAVYPGMVYDRYRLVNWVPGVLLNIAIHGFKMTFLKKYRPVKRRVFSQEIVKIIDGQSSPLTKIIK